VRRDRYVGLDIPGLDWAAAARLFGLAHVRIGHTGELRDVIGAPRSGPLLVEVPTMPHAAA
jgi:benzoylformate decarboxylase